MVKALHGRGIEVVLEGAADASKSYADSASKFMKQQQRNMLLGGLKSKFF